MIWVALKGFSRKSLSTESQKWGMTRQATEILYVEPPCLFRFGPVFGDTYEHG